MVETYLLADDERSPRIALMTDCHSVGASSPALLTHTSQFLLVNKRLIPTLSLAAAQQRIRSDFVDSHVPIPPR